MYNSMLNMLSDDVTAPEIRNPLIWRGKTRRGSRAKAGKLRFFFF